MIRQVRGMTRGCISRCGKSNGKKNHRNYNVISINNGNAMNINIISKHEK